MLRFRTLALATLLLPSFASAQEARSHTVVRGNTLWGLAQEYYSDATQWPKIYEANRDVISNPNRISPGLVIMIPGVAAATASAAPMEILITAGPPGQPPAQVVSGPPKLTTFEPTVFAMRPETRVIAPPMGIGMFDVPIGQFYSAAWLIPPATTPEHSGNLESLSGGEDARTTRSSLRSYDRVDVRVTGATPAVGSRLQSFRIDHSIPDVGQVIVPTGLLRVEASSAGGVVARVESDYDLIQLGDLVRAAPQYTPRPATAGVPAAAGGVEATILGFAEERAVQSVGNLVFLDVGATERVNIGDEYSVIWTDTPDFPGAVEGRVKVVAVLQNTSTARIIHLSNPVFLTGVKVRPVLRVP